MALSLDAIFNDLLSQVWFELTFLLVVSLFAGFIFSRFGQPKVVAFIVVGVAIGPSVLNIIKFEDAGTGVDALPEGLNMLASLGAIVLLFMIGLECDLKEIYTRRSLTIALGGVIVPWIAGYILANALGYPDAESIFIGATLVATSVAVTAGVTSELGLMGTPVAYAIIGAAVVDDVMGMVVLSISKGLTGGALDPMLLLLLVIGAVVFVVVGAWIGSRYLTKLVLSVQTSGFRRKLPMSGFVLAMSIAFIYAFVAEMIQISAIVGAFVAGTAFSSSVLRDGLRKGMQYLEALFVPIFFVSLGLAVDLTDIWDVLVFAGVLTVVAILTKVVGCGLPARATGMTSWDAASVGIGMTPRLEIALIIAYYGLESGIIDGSIYTAVVFMGLVTALIAPPLLKATLRRAGHTLLS